MGWQGYDGGRSARRLTGQVAVFYRSGDLGLSREAWALLGNPERLRLLYDGAREAIGLRAARDGEHAVSARASKGTVLRLNAKGFCGHFHVPIPAVRQHYPVHLEDGVLVMGLTAEAAVPVTTTADVRRALAGVGR